MKPGRELDALVAEKVMSWARVGEDFHTSPAHRPSLDFPGRIIDDWDSKGPHDYLVPPGLIGNRARDRVAFCGCEGDARLPYFSTDIAAAWQVVEHLRASLDGNEWTGEFKLFFNGCEYEYWWSFSRTTAEGLYETSKEAGVADTAPHAICLAALKAVGVEV